MVEQQPSKLNTRVRFPSPAPRSSNPLDVGLGEIISDIEQGQSCSLANSYAKQSPKLRPAAWTPLPQRAYAKATRRADAGATATALKPNPSISFVISSPTLRRAATINASAMVVAEIRISSSRSSAAIHAFASASSSTIAISADVSTAMIRASRHRRRGNPGFVRHRVRALLLPRRSLVRLRAGLDEFSGRIAALPEPAARLMSVPGQDHFVTGLGAAYEFGQLSLCFSNGNSHGLPFQSQLIKWTS